MGGFIPRGQLAISGYVLVVTAWGGGSTGIQWVQVRVAAKHPTRDRIIPCNKEVPGPKWQYCWGGKPCSKPLPLKVRVLDQYCRHCLGTCKNCRLSGPRPDLLNQNLHLNKIPWWLVWALSFEKPWSIPWALCTGHSWLLQGHQSVGWTTI